MIDYVIKRAEQLGADDAICTVVSGKSRQLKFANNEIVLSTIWNATDVYVYLTLQKKVIFGSLNLSNDRFKKESIDDFLKRLIKTAKVTEEKRDYYGIAEGPFKYKDVEDTFDNKIVDLGEKRVDFVEKAINRALEEGAKRCAGVLYTNYMEIEKATSGNVNTRDKGTSINLSIRAFADKDASGHSVVASRILKEFRPEKAGEEAGRLAKESLKPLLGKPGKYDVVFGPMAGANMLFNTGYQLSAFMVDAGQSFFVDKLNQKVSGENVSILDDGRLKNGFGSRKFDDEGFPTQKNKLIENGVLKNYLHNTSTAKKFSTQSTGNAGIPVPKSWNLILEKGDRSFDELISEAKNGLYITNSWYTRFTNYRTGDFSTIPRDAMFEIKNGKITKPVNNLRLSDNMLRILKNIIAIEKESRTVQWWEIESPVVTGHFLCRDVVMTKSAK